jgi:threonine dehydratase
MTNQSTPVPPLEAVPLAAIFAARERIKGSVVRTPLVRLNVDADAEIYLKLETLQPIGSFKLRGAGNAMRLAGTAALERGVYTVSAGNMAQGVAWTAREMGVPCTVIVPETAPATKLDSVRRLGAEIEKVPYDVWHRVFVEHRYEGMRGVFIHPVADAGVMAGNGTIALEILEDLPEVDEVLVPFGGGGLSCGIAAALRPLKPDARVYGCECNTAAPLFAALQANDPMTVAYNPSFVDGIGGRQVLPEMWPVIRDLIAGSLVVSLEEVATAVRLLVERARVVAEGAGAASVAAAMQRKDKYAKIVCVVSGGNIDTDKLCTILSGKIP